MDMTALINIGNTCFLNSTLQCLVHIDELNMFLDKLPPSPNLLLKEYNDLRLLMLQGHSTITPKRFVYVVHHVCKEKQMELFTTFNQYDLSEFLRFLINEFHTAIKQNIEVTIPPNLSDIDKKCYEMVQSHYKDDYSFIIDCFYGISVSIIETDKIQSIIPEPFFILDLPIPSIENVSIYDCIQTYMQPEIIQWQDTNNYIPATKKIQMWKMPHLLFVVFKRFNNTNHKNNQHIHVPFQITLYNLSYDLICVCNHYGNVNTGHYSTLIHKENWIEIDDSSVTTIANDKVITNNAYCLLFRKNN